MSKYCIRASSVCLAVVILLTLTLSNIAHARTTLTPSFGPPPTNPPNEHPRVMFRAADIPNIRANMASPEGAYAVNALNTLLNGTTFDGYLPARGLSPSNSNYTGYATVEAYAFDYALNKDAADPQKAAIALANGNKAITAMKNIIATFQFSPTASDIVREKGMVVYLSALVYDWCFPLMTSTDKALFVDKVEELAATIDGMGGWPIQFQNGLTGHINETHILRDLLAFSIASYDEYPDIYNFVGGYVQDTYVQSKNWWYQSGSYHQGLGYNSLRFQCDLWAQFLFYRMNGTKLFNDDMEKVPYMMLYNNRPDKRSLPEGDSNVDQELALIPTWIRDDMPNLLYVSSIYGDGYLKGEFKTYSNNFQYLKYTSMFPQLSPVNFLIVNNPNVTSLSKEDLPKTRLFGSPNGLMVARTGLHEGVTQPDVIAWAKIGETFPGNHAHLDSGTFQIYYKGPLAMDSGKYDSYASPHDTNYAKETISHNGLLIYDPSETTTAFSNIPAPINSGGQKRKATDEAFTYNNLISDTYHMGDVLGMEFGNDPINP